MYWYLQNIHSKHDCKWSNRLTMYPTPFYFSNSHHFSPFCVYNCIQVKFVELILPVAKIVACRWGIGHMLTRLTLFWEKKHKIIVVTGNLQQGFRFCKCRLEKYQFEGRDEKINRCTPVTQIIQVLSRRLFFVFYLYI